MSSSSFPTFLSLQICSNFHWISPDFFTIPDNMFQNKLWFSKVIECSRQWTNISSLCCGLLKSMALTRLPVKTNCPMLLSRGKKKFITNTSTFLKSWLEMATNLKGLQNSSPTQVAPSSYKSMNTNPFCDGLIGFRVRS